MYRPILFVTVCGTLAAQSPPLIDLVKHQAMPWKRPPIGGKIASRCFDCPPQPEPRLPLEVHLESIEPAPDQPRGSVVTVLIRNTGSSDYLLPTGRDPDVALKPGNVGRREFWFDLKVAGERYSYLSGQETYGAEKVPETTMKIPPQGTVRVRFRIDIARALEQAANHWRTDHPAEIDVEAALVDNVYEDGGSQYILAPALDAVSTNALRVPVAR
jgi:hypothetical protein